MSVDENYHLCVFDYVEKDKGYSKLIFEIGWLGEWGGGRGGGGGGNFCRRGSGFRKNERSCDVNEEVWREKFM